MPQQKPFLRLRGIGLNRKSALPLHRQLYEELRKQILDGTLPSNTPLPATRKLAKELKISRNTVLNAYKQLLAEGYLEATTGGYTRVTHTLPDHVLNIYPTAQAKQIARTSQSDLPPPKLSELGEKMASLPYPYWDRSGGRPFSSSQPNIKTFPFKTWEKCLVASWRKIEAAELSYPPALGYWPLRETIAEYVQDSRGVRCTAEQVVITNGTQHALTTVFGLLLNPKDQVWVENPSYNGVKIALNQVGVELVPVPVDESGLVVDEGIRKAPNGRMVCISPSHQYPLGVTMSLTRRLELLDWAKNNEAWIIEDDYDSEYRYAGYPLEAIQGLDQAGRVIYMGTFSKVLFPALRLGYMILPQSLVEPYHATRVFTDRGTRLLEQATVNEFMNEGHLGRHIRKMRTLYEGRQNILVEKASIYLKNLLDLPPSDVGLHLVGWLPLGANDRKVSDHLLKNGIYAPPLSYFSLEPLERGGLVIGYAAVDEREIVSAVRQMGISLQSVL
ncbi:MAG: PLP-dependent aminotransferase family protein [Chloroflexota bacterium]